MFPPVIDIRGPWAPCKTKGTRHGQIASPFIGRNHCARRRSGRARRRSSPAAASIRALPCAARILRLVSARRRRGRRRFAAECDIELRRPRCPASPSTKVTWTIRPSSASAPVTSSTIGSAPTSPASIGHRNDSSRSKAGMQSVSIIQLVAMATTPTTAQFKARSFWSTAMSISAIGTDGRRM